MSTRRPLRVLVALAVLMVVVFVSFVTIRHFVIGDRTCVFKGDSATFRISPAEYTNAKLVAAVADDLGLPHHAVTVALAAGLQESKLRNLAGGDRDSVGIFQQRPSQGWGTPAQLRNPRFATIAFYRALVKILGWESLPVTVAAQRVQRSSAPTAYEKWEAEARALARILTREVDTTVTCKKPALL